MTPHADWMHDARAKKHWREFISCMSLSFWTTNLIMSTKSNFFSSCKFSTFFLKKEHCHHHLCRPQCRLLFIETHAACTLYHSVFVHRFSNIIWLFSLRVCALDMYNNSHIVPQIKTKWKKISFSDIFCFYWFCGCAKREHWTTTKNVFLFKSHFMCNLRDGWKCNKIKQHKYIHCKSIVNRSKVVSIMRSRSYNILARSTNTFTSTWNKWILTTVQCTSLVRIRHSLRSANHSIL